MRAWMLARDAAIGWGSAMDERLVAWGRAVKARGRLSGPVLWLFTDAARGGDVLAAVAALPRGLCGVVFRHDGVAGRTALAARVAVLCRARRLGMTVAGDWRLAARLGVGVHLRGGRGRRLVGRVCTASAHDVAEVRRGLAAGALVFVSPVWRTASHPGQAGLGVVRWAAMARAGGGRVLALGGVDGASVRRLPGGACGGVGAIGALM